MASRAKPAAVAIHHNGTAADRKPWMTALEQRLAQAQTELNSSRRQLLQAILDNADDNHFLSSRSLAKRYQVDKATIVRSIQALGYKRYAEFATDLRAHFISRITPYTLMKSAAREKRTVAGHVEHSLEMDLHNLQALRSTLDANDVIQMAKRLGRARRILVVGVDFAAGLSYLMAYALVSLGYNAEAPVGSSRQPAPEDQPARRQGPADRDQFWPLSAGHRRCGPARPTRTSVPTFGITDSEKTPIARFCDFFWVASIANPSFHGSYVAPFAAMDALFVACAHLQPKRSLALLRRKDQDSRSRWYSPDASGTAHRRNSKEDSHVLPGLDERNS